MVLGRRERELEIGNEDQRNLLPHLQVKCYLRTGRKNSHHLESAAGKVGSIEGNYAYVSCGGEGKVRRGI